MSSFKYITNGKECSVCGEFFSFSYPGQTCCLDCEQIQDISESAFDEEVEDVA